MIFYIVLKQVSPDCIRLKLVKAYRWNLYRVLKMNLKLNKLTIFSDDNKGYEHNQGNQNQDNDNNSSGPLSTQFWFVPNV